jgi:hypothetical protein
MQRNLFTPSEQSTLVLAAMEVQSDKSIDKFLAKLERIFVGKLAASSEAERLLGLNNGK